MAARRADPVRESGDAQPRHLPERPLRAHQRTTRPRQSDRRHSALDPRLRLLHPRAGSPIRRTRRALLPTPRPAAPRPLPAPARPPARATRKQGDPRTTTGGRVNRDFQYRPFAARLVADRDPSLPARRCHRDRLRAWLALGCRLERSTCRQSLGYQRRGVRRIACGRVPAPRRRRPLCLCGAPTPSLSRRGSRRNAATGARPTVGWSTRGASTTPLDRGRSTSSLTRRGSGVTSPRSVHPNAEAMVVPWRIDPKALLMG